MSTLPRPADTPEAAAAFDGQDFRKALGSFTTGVTIVTTSDAEGRDVGMTANSFNSVSLKPPMVLWSLAKTSSSIDAFRQAPHFAVHILAADQEGLSARFSTKGIDRFEGLLLERGDNAIPLLPGCAARLECRTAFQHEGGDHIIFVGEVTALTTSDQPPLVFHGGRYSWVIKKENGEADDRIDQTDRSLTPDDLLYHLARAYHRIRYDAVLERHRRGWSEAEYFVVAMLSIDGDLPLHHLEALVHHRGYAVTAEVLDALTEGGLITRSGQPGPGAKLGLTEAGKRAFIEVIAVAKAAEADAVQHISREELRLLKQLLQRLVPGQEGTKRVP